MATLAELKTQRAKLDAVITEAELQARTAWNDRLCEIENALDQTGLVTATWNTRKNERIATLRGGTAVRLGFLEGNYGPWLTIKSADGYELSWCDYTRLPGITKFVDLVRRLSSDADVEAEERDFPGRGREGRNCDAS